MSRRRRGSGGDPRRRAQAPSEPSSARTPSEEGASDAGGRKPSLGVQIAVLAAIFVVVTAVAELAGAANLGVAIGIGQIAFALAVVWMLLRGP